MLQGGDGNDTLVGGPDDDTLDGNGPSAGFFFANADEADYSTAPGPITASTVTGVASGEGNDTLIDIESIRGSAFADDLTAGRVNGGPGDDLLDAEQLDYSNAPGPLTIDITTTPGTATGDGTDTIDTADFSDFTEEEIRATPFADVIVGRSDFGASYIQVPTKVVPGDGDDTVTAALIDYSGFFDGEISDVFFSYEPPARPGDFAGAPGPVAIDLAAGTVTGAWGTDTLIGVVDAFGSRFDDTINGSSADNELRAMDGDDTVTGGDGWDFITGADGNDDLDGGPGNDFIVGDGRNPYPTLGGATFDDVLKGGADDDIIEPRAGDDSIDGGPGDDFIRLQADRQQDGDFDPGTGAAVDLAAGTVTGQGTDSIVVGSIEAVGGTRYADTLLGDGADNWFAPLEGDDTIDGRGGTNEADFGLFSNSTAFRDTQFPGQPAVTVDLAAGTATGHGTDSLTNIQDVTGGSGDDTISGDGADNVLAGRGGNDTLNGRGGDDTLDGGFNSFGPGTGDTVTYVDAAGPVDADLESGVATGSSTDTLIDIENLIGGPFADSLRGGPANNVLEGGGGDDFLDGRFGIDTMDGGPQNDECVVTTGLELFETTISCETVSSGPAPPAGTTDVTEVGPNDFVISDVGPINDGRFQVGFGGTAVAYNPVADEYLVVFTGDDTVDDEFVVLGQRLDAAGNQIGTNDFLIGRSAFRASEVSVVYNPTDDEYLVAWTATLDPRTFMGGILVQRLDAAGNEVGADDVEISELGTGTSYHVDVAYNGVDNEYLVAFTGTDGTATAPMADDETEVFVQRLSSTGAEIGVDDRRISDVNDIGITSDFFTFFDGVAVAHDATDNDYLVAWVVTDNAVDPIRQLPFGQVLEADGSEKGPNDFLIDPMTGANGFASRPDVVWNSTHNEYFAVWEGDLGNAPDYDSEIYARRVGTAGAPVGALLKLSEMGGPGDTDSQAYAASVAYDPVHDRYFVVWHGTEPPLAANEYEIFGQWMTGNPSPIGPDDVRLTDVGSDGDPFFDLESPAAVYNPTVNEWLLVADGNDYPLASGETEVYGQRVRFPGTIRITKDSQPDDAQDVSFTYTGPESGAFTLDDDADATLPNTINLSDIAEGTYTITETVPPGWMLTSITCSDLTAVVDLTAGSVTVDLSFDEVIDCTFVDVPITVAPQGTITIIKDAVPNDAQDFGFSGELGVFSLDDDADATLPNQITRTVATGTYTVTEAATTGWDLTGLVCVDPDGGSSTNLSTATATVDLDADETVTCTFTNTKRPTTPTTTTTTTTTVPPTGTIQIVYDAVPDDPQDVAFSGALGAFSLDDDALIPQLVEPSGQAGNLSSDLPNTRSFVVAPGAYAVTLAVPTGWTLTGLTCADPDSGSSTNLSTATATVDLDAGETVTCTFTNTRQPTPPAQTTVPPATIPMTALPGTGGSSTIPFAWLAAALLLAGSLVIGVTRRRQTNRSG
jgi:LPXTG-motif cell wall-anchored protein